MNQQAALCLAFEAMERDEQMDALQRDGVYIGKRKVGKGTSLLYQYQSIYVQITYSVHRLHIDGVHCFTDTGILDEYHTNDDFSTHDPDLG